MPDSSQYKLRNPDEANTIDIKLFPQYDDPPQVFDYEVPIMSEDVTGVVDKHWDMTLVYKS